jgi:hypothetical protein
MTVLPSLVLVALLLSAFCTRPAWAAESKGQADYFIGVAKIDVTPDYPIRLNGYGSRRTESEGILQHLFAKAIAIGRDEEGPALLVTVDNCVFPEYLREELLKRLAQKKITSEKFAVCTSHTHSAPKLVGDCDTVFSSDIPPEHQVKIDRYTKELTDKIEQVAFAALRDRKPAKLSWGKSTVGFAANRRTAGGPVDHDLPLLKVADKDGKIKALLVNYACHCTTLPGNEIGGDWAGYAQEYLERDHPGAIALALIGCGADADPSPRMAVDHAMQHGQSIARAVGDLLSKKLTPLNGKLECRTKRIALPYDKLPTREEWEKRTQSPDQAIVYHAKKNLARLDRNEKLPTELPYLVQTWNFGHDLAMVFLNGEVVVDYSLRLKKEFDADRLWITAYANGVPGYIPSKRIWREGGYEGGAAMVYFDRPTRLAEQTEDLIFDAIRYLMPPEFLSPKKAAAAGP